MNTHTNTLYRFLVILTLAILFTLIYGAVNPAIKEARSSIKELKSKASISLEDYENMTADVSESIETSNAVLTDNQGTLYTLESATTFYKKEDILDIISESCSIAGVQLKTFYITEEGPIKSLYSVSVTGSIIGVQEFTEYINFKIKGISSGEFSVKQNYDIEYLRRVFDNANVHVWFNGKVGDVIDAADKSVNTTATPASISSEETTNPAPEQAPVAKPVVKRGKRTAPEPDPVLVAPPVAIPLTPQAKQMIENATKQLESTMIDNLDSNQIEYIYVYSFKA